MKKSRETDSVQGHSDVSIDRARRKEERDPLLSPHLHCYPVAPAGGQESVRLGISCTETDAQACVNDSLSPRMSAGCRSACYSLQVKCLWRHMEQGKLTTRGNSPEQREALLVSPPNKI
ncbi:hypothetical protein JOQ06_003266 [Pogonophryne albipinna]|uniref:Uncharacterized protein n=1 Tax=Pogonophryne albipinna TaxID=1090488 RepID=A0AAD6FLJ4_9TELE|nr:hypothetical protein JOQ06_003266 [Pogonophryne albipinna]